MTKYKYTQQEFENAVRNSTSIRQALQLLNVVPAGGNYQTFKKTVKKWNVDISHFEDKTAKIKSYKHPIRPITDYLDNKQTTTSHRLRKRLIKDGLFEEKCCVCNLTQWNGKPIPLELEHVDGNHENNSLENLQILCPNCHAQTPTHRRRKS